jgi:hypothetical protein
LRLRFQLCHFTLRISLVEVEVGERVRPTGTVVTIMALTAASSKANGVAAAVRDAGAARAGAHVFCGVDMRVDKLDREVNRWLADGR